MKICIQSFDGDLTIPVSNKDLASALQIIADKIEKDEFPEDEWYGISKDLDLQMFHIDGAICATIYPVINGNIVVTEGFLPLLELQYEETDI